MPLPRRKNYTPTSRATSKHHITARPCKTALAEDKIKETVNDAKKDTPRNFALINLLLRTGLGTNRARGARKRWATLSHRGAPRPQSVGKRQRQRDAFVIVSDKAFAPLKAYLDARHAHQGEPLFTSDSRRKRRRTLTTRTISAICKNHLVNIGLIPRIYGAPH